MKQNIFERNKAEMKGDRKKIVMLVDKNISYLESYHKRNYGFAIRLKFYSVKAVSYLFASG